MSGVKVTNERSSGPIPAVESVDGEVDGDNVDWEPGDAGTSELDQWKQPVRAATTANITIATALNAGDTLDGVTLVAGDRVLVKDQASAEQNGIYVAGATAERAVDLDEDDEVLGAVVYVIAGTANGGTAWAVTNTAATVVDTDAIDWAALGTGGGGGGGGTTLPWFIVTDAAYGAVGDGTTDDTAAINLAIAALNTATHGVLYFPTGTYKVTAALTGITVTALIVGDGIEASKITCTSTTAVLFTLTGAGVTVRDLWLNNSATTSAGAAIRVSSGGNLNRYENLLFHGWWIGLDIQTGTAWAGRGLFMESINKYGASVTGTGPDWSIADSYFSGVTSSPDAAIYIAPGSGADSGGGKIINTKINGSAASGYGTGIDLVVANGQATSILLISNCSIENVRGDAIRATTTGTGRYSHITITGCQVGLYSNNAGRAVKLTAATNGVFGANGSLGIVTIDGSVFTTDGTARAAVELTKTDRVTLGDLTLSGFNARYTSSADTNTVDSGATISFATPSGGYGTAAAGAASTAIRSDAVFPKPTAADVDFSADVTTNNATTGHHGLLPKLDGNAAHGLLGDGTWGSPAATVTAASVRDAGRWEPTVDDGTDTLIFDAHTVVMDWTTS